MYCCIKNLCSRLKCRCGCIKIKTIFKKIPYILFHWHHRIHLYVYLIVLLIASLISYYKSFGLLYNLKHMVPERLSIMPIRNNLINKQKQEQKQAYEWLDNLWKNSKNYSHIISNQTQQSRFYDFIQLQPTAAINLSTSSYKLYEKPKRISLNNTENLLNDRIVISILYSQQDIDHRDGKFYIGQVLYHLLKNHHPRFIITLCENDNTDSNKIPDDIDLIRHLVPVFLINTTTSNQIIDTFEQEKQAHLQCILANFQSFPNLDYLLLLQDDAPPVHEDFYDRFLSLIDNRIKQQWPSNGYRKQPAFIKIYHPRWLLDYLHPSYYTIIQLITTSLILTYLGFTCFYLYQLIKQNNKRIFLNQSWWQYSGLFAIRNNIKILYRMISLHIDPKYFLCYFILITFVLFLINHSNVSWVWRSLHPSFYAIYPAPSCCLPGVLYFRQTYMQVIDYLNSVQCVEGYAIDTAFDDLPKRIHLRTYLVEPNLLHHIGLYSRLRHMYINPYLLD